jgi:hypothetical protein
VFEVEKVVKLTCGFDEEEGRREWFAINGFFFGGIGGVEIGMWWLGRF